VFISRPRDPHEGPLPWWGMVVAGVAFIAVGILALLAYSYWGWDARGRVGWAAIVLPPAGLVLVVWGIGRWARGAVRRLRDREHGASTAPPAA
jgi:hypothetical protein